MFNRNERKAARERRPVLIAGAAFAIVGIAFSATAEAPALAADRAPRPGFDEAFAALEPALPAMAPGSDSALSPRAASAATAETAEVRPLSGGVASFYGAGFSGRPTASGEPFNPSALTAAHRTLPFGTRVRVTNPRTGLSVVVRVNDRGPFHSSRVIDLSQEAARQIGIIRQGSGVVQLAALDS
jgi:rare lipoprotein A